MNNETKQILKKIYLLYGKEFTEEQFSYALKLEYTARWVLDGYVDAGHVKECGENLSYYFYEGYTRKYCYMPRKYTFTNKCLKYLSNDE